MPHTRPVLWRDPSGPISLVALVAPARDRERGVGFPLRRSRGRFPGAMIRSWAA